MTLLSLKRLADRVRFVVCSRAVGVLPAAANQKREKKLLNLNNNQKK